VSYVAAACFGQLLKCAGQILRTGTGVNGTSVGEDLPELADLILDDSLSNLMTECIKIVRISPFASNRDLSPPHPRLPSCEVLSNRK
jgi:hypothetical protein